MGRFSWRALGDRPAFFPALALVLGAAFAQPTGATGWVFLALAALLAAVAIRLSGRTGAHLLLLGAFFLGGYGLSTFAARPKVPSSLLDGGALRLEAVVEESSVAQGVTRLTVAALRSPDLPGEALRFRAQLYTQGELSLLAGQRVMAPVKLTPIEPASNPGERELRPVRLRRAVRFKGGFEAERLAVLSEAPAGQSWLTRQHQQLALAVRRLAPSPEASALFLTLAAGLRAELGEELEEDFAKSGLAHVLSVSGLHVAALAILALRALRRAWLFWPRTRALESRRLAAPLCIPIVWAYVLFTGSQAPAIRSAAMATILFAGMALWRSADPLNGLALALMALVALDPGCIADLSMQLSLVAVTSLLVLAPAFRAALPWPLPSPSEHGGLRLWLDRAREAALTTFCASLAVTLAGAPIIASAFQRVSLAGLISNIVCLPLCGLLTVLAAGSAGLFVLWAPAAVPLLYLGGLCSELLLGAVNFFSQLPGASLPMPTFSAPATALFFVGLLFFSLGEGRWRLGALATPVGLALALSSWVNPAGLEVTFLAVGHGDAVVLSSNGDHALIDGGGVPQGADTGRRFVLPYLRQKGVERLSLAVLSHPHPDHALGLASTLEKIPTGRLWIAKGSSGGELTRLVSAAARVAPEEIETGSPSFSLGEAKIEILGPPKDRALLEGANDSSIVLRVRHGHVTFLLAGDVEEAGEEFLAPGEITVVKAPHHGSSTSSTERFVDQVRPRFVVFCVGRRNRYGFPEPEIVERYRAAGARCYRTDLDGAIRFRSDGEDVEVDTFLDHDEQPPSRLAGAPQAAQL